LREWLGALAEQEIGERAGGDEGNNDRYGAQGELPESESGCGWWSGLGRRPFNKPRRGGSKLRDP
jgi:hypothetical protein